VLHSTLDPHLQDAIQQIVDASLATLAPRRVHDAAVLVVDHAHNEVLAWVNGHIQTSESRDRAVGYDTVLVPRQPGSTMKPLLYAMALEKGWTAATIIDDSELSEAVGSGVHTFHNYSHVHYGNVRLREALGNSLNIPAVKTLKFVGIDAFLDQLHRLGITGLEQNPVFYGDGLALGNGEISLYEMTQAYTALARNGRYLPLTNFKEDSAARQETAAYTPEAASLIASVLSDPDARMLEFGRGLQFPVETAIKTGTSTDYRDAWAIAFDYAHTVGVWIGNLDDEPMDGITGAEGPALILRSIFTELNRNQETHGLPLSRTLLPARICRKNGKISDGECESITEWFAPGSVPQVESSNGAHPPWRLLQPTPGLMVAHDPRIPDELQALPMSLDHKDHLQWVQWYVDGRLMSRTRINEYAWHLERGTHEVFARVMEDGTTISQDTPLVRFYVR
jgi:penicillin-binding protein 1C